MAFSDNFNTPALGTGYGGATGAGRNAGDFGAFASGNLNTDWSPTGMSNGGGFMSGAKSFGSTLGGTSLIGPDGPTFGQSLFGGITEKGDAIGGMAGGIFDVATKLGAGYMNWKNLKLAEKESELQQQNWMKNYEASKHAYNQEARVLNNARRSRSKGAIEVQQMA